MPISSPPQTLRVKRRLRALILLVGMAALLAACSAGRESDVAAGPSSAANARSGALTLSGGRVPFPASPAVGVAYFTLTNAGSTDDLLVAASSPAARSVVPMKDVTSHGASTMVAVSSLTVPAHGETNLEPGGLHLMLQHLTRHLQVGDHVILRLRFAHAGLIRVTLPVTPLVGGFDNPSDMNSMPGM